MICPVRIHRPAFFLLCVIDFPPSYLYLFIIDLAYRCRLIAITNVFNLNTWIFLLYVHLFERFLRIIFPDCNLFIFITMWLFFFLSEMCSNWTHEDKWLHIHFIWHPSFLTCFTYFFYRLRYIILDCYYKCVQIEHMNPI